MQITISRVEDEDINHIYNLAEDWLVSNLESTEGGFLVSNFTIEQYKSFVEQDKVFLKAVVENEIVGFLLGYNSELITQSEVVNNCLQSSLSEDFFLIKQVCIKKNSEKTAGVAKELYDFVQSLTSRMLAAAIVLEPSNPKSIKFHERLGFSKILEMTPPADPDGKVRLRGVWLRTINNSQVPYRVNWKLQELSESTLVEYHNTSTELYTHEDNLNWTKLSLNISFLLALFASTPFLYRELDSSLMALTLNVTVICIGFFINFLFGVKLKSGIEYMNHHKESVKRIEKLLSKEYFLHPLLNVSNNHISQKSKTSKILSWFPRISQGFWLFVSVVLLIRFV